MNNISFTYQTIMVIRPFTVDSRQGYESSTVHTSDHGRQFERYNEMSTEPTGIRNLNKTKNKVFTGTGTNIARYHSPYIRI